VKRGEVVVIAAGGPFTGKPRPAVILQSDAFVLDSITVSLITSERSEDLLFRVPVLPTTENGLSQDSWIMADKIVTLRRQHVSRVIGYMGHEDMQRLHTAILIFLGMPGASFDAALDPE